MSGDVKKKGSKKHKNLHNEPPLELEKDEENSFQSLCNAVSQEVAKGKILNPDDFEVLSLIGNGGFGTVSRVRHKPTGMEMAQKEIRYQAESQTTKQICTELMILRTADCSSIVQFHGSYFQEDRVYIYMELMDTSINNIQEPVTEDFLKKVAQGILRATFYLKSKLKIMHRDLKPSNVLVNSKGEIKLCDFGISGELVDSLAKTYQGSVIYMAPERVHPETSKEKYNTKSDVWSLGVTLLELGNGSHPFAAQEMFKALDQILGGNVPPLSNRFSPAAQSFVAKCLTRNKEQRPDYKDLLQDPWILS